LGKLEFKLVVTVTSLCRTRTVSVATVWTFNLNDQWPARRSVSHRVQPEAQRYHRLVGPARRVTGRTRLSLDEHAIGPAGLARSSPASYGHMKESEFNSSSLPVGSESVSHFTGHRPIATPGPGPPGRRPATSEPDSYTESVTVRVGQSR
jgi:hypothetical protein